jgi:ketosteroid isomerase-like protein
MARKQLPPVAVVISFIDCINRGDADGLGALMTDDHELAVFDEQALRGKAPNIEAWKGYASAFPHYVIYPHAVAELSGDRVAVLGHTTGSHLGLSDQEERKLSVIWLAKVQDGKLRCWRLLEDTPTRRSDLGLSQLT